MTWLKRIGDGRKKTRPGPAGVKASSCIWQDGRGQPISAGNLRKPTVSQAMK
jgi:hypothetical protein